MLQRLRSRPILLALLALAVAAVLWAGWKGLRLYRLAMDLRGQASTLAGLASGDIEDFDLAHVHSQIQAARGSADALCGELALFQPLLARLGWVPHFGPLLASAYPAVEYAAALTAAGDELLTGLTPLLESPDGAPASSAGERLLIGLQAAEPHLASAEGHFERAVAARSGISLEALPASLAGPLARLDPLLPAAAPALQALQALPQALGAEQPRSYLLLAQNQDELRATGGFISGAGVLALHEGAIQAMELGDSYALDDLSKPYPAPPEPLRRYMQAGYWLLRDANWSPDFPTSATQALDLYQLSTGERPDGVVAFDQTAIQRLLVVLGPVEVPHLQETVTSENVIDFMRQSWGAAPGAEVEPDCLQAAAREAFPALLRRRQAASGAGGAGARWRPAARRGRFPAGGRFQPGLQQGRPAHRTPDHLPGRSHSGCTLRQPDSHLPPHLPGLSRLPACCVR